MGSGSPEDPGAPNNQAKKGNYMFPLGLLWDKGVAIGTGQTPVKKYAIDLRNMIISGIAKPGFIVSHRIPLNQAAEAYTQFDKRGTNTGADYTKVLLKPGKNS